MEGFCRGCLIKYDDPEELLEYTEKNRRLFIYSTGLQVKRNDSFTFQLCKDCYLNMKQSCKFKKLCRTSDKKFKTYLSLKEAGDTVDLCTYLKNNDDNFTLRFPNWGGNSTPANQKKDDDNESTCTSIGNFMRDILQGTEMKDSEARIIRQVIEEEADVLDESIDSHWLQDDVSIDTNFQLDFSFSPFSTPRSVNNDHCYTPKRLVDQGNHYGLPKVISEKSTAQTIVNDNEIDDKSIEIKDFDIFSDSLLEKIGDKEYETSVKIETLYDHEIAKIENDLIVEEVDALSENQVNSKNYYVDNTLIEQTVNDVVRILEGQHVEERSTGVTTIYDHKNAKETQRAVASLFDGKGTKSHLDNVDVFNGKSGKFQMDIDISPGKGVSETQRAVASIFHDDSSKNEKVSVFYSKNVNVHTDGKHSKNKKNVFNSKSGKNQAEVSGAFSKSKHSKKGKKANDPLDITSGKTIVDGVGGKNLLLQSVLEGKSVESQNDDSIERRLEEALKEENQEVTLEDLLGSSAANPNTAASTPTIHNIIFGEKLDSVDDPTKVGNAKLNKDKAEVNIFNDIFDTEIKEEIKTPPPSPQAEAIEPKTLTINVSDNLSVNVSYNLPEAQQKQKEDKKLPESDCEDVEIVDCVCKICDKKFKDMRTLKLHSYRKHKIQLPRAKKRAEVPKLRICDFCGKQTMDKRNFVRHMKTHIEPKEIRCEKCGVTFHSKAKFNMHYKTHLGHNHKKQPGDRVYCDVCGRQVLKKSLYKHLRIHQKQYRGHCEDCGKGYYTPADYRAHKLEHTGERPHACEVCGDKFIRRNALIRHMRAHTGEKRFACDNCHKRYSNKSTLVQHISKGSCRDFRTTGKMNKVKRVPIRPPNTIKVFKLLTEEELAMKPFECVYCHSRHKSENLLIRHQQISKKCKEIQFKEIAPTIIEILYEKAEPIQQDETEDFSINKA